MVHAPVGLGRGLGPRSALCSIRARVHEVQHEIQMLAAAAGAALLLALGIKAARQRLRGAAPNPPPEAAAQGAEALQVRVPP